MTKDMQVAIATDRMADAMEKLGVLPIIVKATRVAAGRQATRAILEGTVV